MQETTINQLFVLDSIKIYPYNNIECIAYNPRNNKKIKLGHADTQIGLRCAQFLTLEDHIDNILKIHIGDIEKGESKLKLTRDDVEKSLKNMLDSGLMITPPEFINELTNSHKSTEPQSNWKNGWMLAICSANRPALVARLLTTITPHLLELPVKPLLIFIDDSRNQESSHQNLKNIKNYCERNGLKYEYWDRNKRSEHCQKVSKDLPECHNSIHYLLSPNDHPENINTTGQARNFAVLRSIGSPLLMLDDDCLINPMKQRDYQPNISLGYSGRKGIVKSSYDELFVSLEKSSVNPFLEHLQILGKTLQSSLSKHESNILNPFYWKYKPRDALIDIRSGGFIGMSVNAIAGALNSRHMNWFYQLDGADLQNGASFLESFEENAGLYIDQATWNGRAHDEISKYIPFIGTTICGISPLAIVPPMPPTGRNQDLALGATINFLYKDTQIYQFGWGLPHLPNPLRQWQPFGEQQDPEQNSTSFYINLIIMLENDCPYTEPEDRLNYLSMYLNKISNTEITSLIKDASYRYHTHMISQTQNSSKEATDYHKYQQGCKKMINFHLNEMKNATDKLPKLQNEVTNLAKSFSQALDDWSTIWSYYKKNKVNL